MIIFEVEPCTIVLFVILIRSHSKCMLLVLVCEIRISISTLYHAHLLLLLRLPLLVLSNVKLKHTKYSFYGVWHTVDAIIHVFLSKGKTNFLE